MVDVSRAAFFTGANGDGGEVAPARTIASKVAKSNPGLDYGLLFSAAAYLLRDGQPTNDGRVIAEAKRRGKMAAEAAAERERRFSREAA